MNGRTWKWVSAGMAAFVLGYTLNSVISKTRTMGGAVARYLEIEKFEYLPRPQLDGKGFLPPYRHSSNGENNKFSGDKLHQNFTTLSLITSKYTESNGNTGTTFNKTHDLQERRMEIQKLDPELFRKFPTNFDERFKNPCWYDQKLLRCVPYFYLIGMPKCGTTDLWDKLVQHPQIRQTPKEPHWWARRRLGWTKTPIHASEVKRIREMTGAGDDRPFEWYLNWFSTYGVNGIKNNHKKVLGDGSVTTSWDIGEGWKSLYPGAIEPPYVMADLIHELQPNAKIIIILREPVDRHYSSYLYCGGKNADEFHKSVVENIACQKNCERDHTPRYCAYTFSQCKLFRGMYYIFLRDWMNAYGRDKIYVITLTEWMSDAVNQYKALSQFLDLEVPSEQEITRIVTRKVQNSQSKKKLQAGVIRPDTKKMLQDFYRPWNKKIAELLNDTKFLWEY